MREVVDESDSIAKDHFTATGELAASQKGVEGREELVSDPCLAVRHCAHLQRQIGSRQVKLVPREGVGEFRTNHRGYQNRWSRRAYQAGLAGVGVSDKGDSKDARSLAPLALLLPRVLDLEMCVLHVCRLCVYVCL